MRICVCGGREFSDWEFFRQQMDDIVYDSTTIMSISKDELTIINGGARGADSMASRYAKENNIKLEVFPADWSKYLVLSFESVNSNQF